MIDVTYSRIAANSFICYNDKNEGFIVDPGYNVDNVLINHIKKLNVKIVAVLLTHGHFDHIHALEDICKEFPDVRVYISSEEKEFLSNPELNLSNEEELREQGVRLLTFVPKNLIIINDNDMINEAGFNVKVIATPFHTRGSVCYYVESEKALFSGDTLFFTTIGRSDLPTGSSRTIESSLAKLKALPDGIKVYPGHGACTSLDREKKFNTYLKNL